MKCVLIRPAYRSSGYDQGTQECLGLGYIGAVLRRAGHDVTVVDAELESLPDRETVERTVDRAPDWVGLSVMSEDALDSTSVVAADLRAALPHVHLTAGGNLASFAPRWVARVAPQLDTLVRFEGERVAVRLCDAVQRGAAYDHIAGLSYRRQDRLVNNPPAAPLADLDTLPFPIRDTLPIAVRQGWMPPLSTSRGCQAKCTFCAVHRFNLDPARPWRFRSPRNVVDEIEQLQAEFGVRDVNFVDDDFIGNRREGQPRAIAIAHEIRRRKLDVGFSLQCRSQWIDKATFGPLKEAGLQMVFFGVETIDPGTRKAYRKGHVPATVRRTLQVLDDLRIYTHVGYIMFQPWTTLDELRASVRFLHDIGHLNIHTATNFLQLSPGTPILDRLLDEGTVFHEPDGGYRYRFQDPRTAAAKAVFDRVIWRMFPAWYQNLLAQWRTLSKETTGKGPSQRCCSRVLARMDDLVFQVATRTLDALEADPRTDLFELSRRLWDDCRAQLETLSEEEAFPLRPAPRNRDPRVPSLEVPSGR